jgi:phenylacetate-CoA ligase
VIGELAALHSALRVPYRPRAELEALRDRRVRVLVRHAWERVPYYRGLLERAGLRPEDVRGAVDLARVPISTKEDLRRAGLSRLSSGLDPGRCRSSTSSGSTGEPLTTVISRSDARARDVARFRALLAMGFRPGDRMAVVGPIAPRRARLHERLGLFRARVVPLSLPIDEQVRHVRAIDPTVLWVFPTVLRAMLDHVGGDLDRLCRPRLVIWSAETLDAVLVRRIGAPGRVALRGAYVATETGLIASECRTGGGLHVAEDRIVLEGTPASHRALPDGAGLAVVTVLDAFAMPVLRYGLGDLCVPLAGSCTCGSSFARIAPPLGREYEVLRLPSGRALSPLRLSWVLQEIENIRRFRTVQERVDRLVIQLDLEGEPAPGSLDRLRQRLLEALGEPVELALECVDLSHLAARKELLFVSQLGPAREGSPAPP